MTLLVLDGYLPVEEAEENLEPIDNFGLAIKLLISFDTDELAFGVGESAFFIVDKKKKRYLQRERLIDLLEWVNQFPIAGHIIDSLTKFNKTEILSVLVDETLPNKLFYADKEFGSMDKIVEFMVSNAKPINECTCSNSEPPDFIYPPQPLMKAIKALGMKGEPWICNDGRVSVKVSESKCYTLIDE